MQASSLKGLSYDEHCGEASVCYADGIQHLSCLSFSASHCLCVPSCGRVEALVGRSTIAQAALGTSHSLFLDGDGGVWSCGENKEVRGADTDQGCLMLIHTLGQQAPSWVQMLRKEMWILRGYSCFAAAPDSVANAPVSRASAGWGRRWSCWPANGGRSGRSAATWLPSHRPSLRSPASSQHHQTARYDPIEILLLPCALRI